MVEGETLAILDILFKTYQFEIFETHFLEKGARTKIRDLYKRPFDEQIRVKLDILSESINKDKTELADFDYQHGIDPDTDPRAITDFNLLKIRNNFINKLKTKERIQRKLQEKLSFLY